MPLNIAHDFTSTTHIDIDNDPYSLATDGLIIHAYDNAAVATRLTPAFVHIATTAPYNIDIGFAQATAGYLAIHPAIPGTGALGNYEATLTVTEAPYTATILGTAHQFATKALLVEVYDTTGMRVEPGMVEVNTSTYDITLTFAQAFSGRAVVCGGYGTGTPSVFDVTEASVTWTITAATHGLGTDQLMLAAYTGTTPAVEIEPGTVTIEGDLDVVLTFAEPLTGTVVLDGSVQSAGWAISPTETLALTETLTVRGLSLHRQVEDVVALGALVLFQGTLSVQSLTNVVAVQTTVTLLEPRLRPFAVETVASMTLVLFEGVIPVQSLTNVVALTDAPTVRTSALRVPLQTDAVSLGTQPLLQGLRLSLLVVEAVALTTPVFLSRRTGLLRTDLLAVGTQALLRGLPLPLLTIEAVAIETTVRAAGTLSAQSLTNVVALTATPTVRTSALRVPLVTEAVALTSVGLLQGLRPRASAASLMALATTVTIRQPVLHVLVTERLRPDELVLFAGQVGIREETALGLTTTVTLRLPRLWATPTLDAVALATTVFPTLRARPRIVEALGVGTLGTVAPTLLVARSSAVSVGTTVSRSLHTALLTQVDLALRTSVTLHVPVPLRADSAALVRDEGLVHPLLLAPRVTEGMRLGTTAAAVPTVLYVLATSGVRVQDAVEVWPPYLPGLLVLDDLANLLEEAALGVQGVTIFKGMLPPDMPLHPIADSIIGLIEVPGLPTTVSHSGPASRVEQPMVQVVVRGSPHEYRTARRLAHAAWTVLDHVTNRRLNGTWYLMVTTNQPPFWLKTDELHRPHMVFTVRAMKEPAKL